MVITTNWTSIFTITGFAKKELVPFVDEVNRRWKIQTEAIAELLNNTSKLDRAYEWVQFLKDAKQYPAACLIDPALNFARTLIASVPDHLPADLVSETNIKKIDAIRAFLSSPDTQRQDAVSRFLTSELDSRSNWFDQIESHPLTAEQRQAVLTDEDGTLVLAAAGSGKTSVIVAKAAYLVESKVREVDEILLLAFNRNAATEMAERLKNRCGVDVKASTFHAFGNSILRSVEGRGAPLSKTATDERSFFKLIKEVIQQRAQQDPEFEELIRLWFADLYATEKTEWNFKNVRDYYRWVDANELRALTGDLVKSYEELKLANWLYMNSIDFIYEKKYDGDVGDFYGVYKPDFFLPKYNIYIEHFGVRRRKSEYGAHVLYTAPWVDRRKYLEGMKWKRKVHAENKTELVETFSYEAVEGSLVDALASKLREKVKIKKRPISEVFVQLEKIRQTNGFVKLLGTFLRHFKGGQHSIDYCRQRAESSANPVRRHAFLDIFEYVLSAYTARLGDEIDFEDMINRAAQYVADGQYKSQYKHILVDEFQDISEDRAKLIDGLKSQHSDARLFVVGDDWQSIYRFAGSDIHIMKKFSSRFGGSFNKSVGVAETVDLGRTFRCVDKIADPARDFILKNPAQITKKVEPFAKTQEPAIRIWFYDVDGRETEVESDEKSAGEEGALVEALNDINATAPKGKRHVLLLGRYKFVEPKNLKKIVDTYPLLVIKFMTIHASKGLEADHVILLSAVSKRVGFPSQIEDDPLLDMVLPESEQFPFAEERRLFYVAITRARYSFSALASREQPSSFISEVKNNPTYEAVTMNGSLITNIKCEFCGGQIVKRQNRKTGEIYFKCQYRICEETLKPCSECEAAAPERDAPDASHAKCECGAVYPSCPNCASGWLVERKGSRGVFWSCVRYPRCDGKLSASNPTPS